MSRQPQRLYVLEGDRPVEEPDRLRWYAWMERSEPRLVIDQTRVGPSVVRTRFAGVPLARPKAGETPKLYVSTVEGGKADGMMRPYLDAGAARAGHAELVCLLERYFDGEADPADGVTSPGR